MMHKSEEVGKLMELGFSPSSPCAHSLDYTMLPAISMLDSNEVGKFKDDRIVGWGKFTPLAESGVRRLGSDIFTRPSEDNS
ncbi:hypothetical protein ES702_06328 [subsurface metagenome]